MQFARFLLALAMSVAFAFAHAQAAPLNAAEAKAVFAQARALCQADAGRLWGISLCVPMMIVDPATRRAFTNRAAPGAASDGSLFQLQLPASAQMSTAPFTYRGTLWAQLTWPLYGNARTQAVTLMHESFHVVQPRLGFSGNADNGSISGDAALDTRAGRIWLRGELHALRAALQATGTARKRALRDAIALRLYRQAQLQGTARRERSLDVLEGLAESTGIDVALPPKQRIPYAIFDMTFVESQPSYARAFPYATGPAYSELLDAVKPNWRRSITPSSDIARMAMRAFGMDVATPTAAQAQAIITRYGGTAIEQEEAVRAVREAQRMKRNTGELVNGATLQLPMHNFHITFNPRDIEAFPPYGSVYHTLRITAAWGTLIVSGGDALIPGTFSFVRIAAPADARASVVHGKGWELDLRPGYKIVSDPVRAGSFMLSKP